MKTIQNELTMSPYAYQICQRLNDLISLWSRAQVEACLVMLDAGLDSSNGLLLRHVSNLKQSYPDDAFNDACDLLRIARRDIFSEVI